MLIVGRFYRQALSRNTRIPLSWNASGVYYLLVERFLCVLCIPLRSSGMKSRLGGLLRTKYFYAILNCFSLRENVTGFQLFLKWLGGRNLRGRLGEVSFEFAHDSGEFRIQIIRDACFEFVDMLIEQKALG